MNEGSLQHEEKYIYQENKYKYFIWEEKGIEEAEDNYKESKSLTNKTGTKFSKVEVNNKFNLDKAEFEVLSVKNNTSNSANESSIVIKLNYLETSYLFMGDAT